jgi:signal transduction histidine kinase
MKVNAEVSEDMPEDHKTCIYRIIQESPHNGVQCAAASTVREQPDGILLKIQDDWMGFCEGQERGMELLGTEEWASHSGGTFTLETQPGHGATGSVLLSAGEAGERSLQTWSRT